MNEPELTLYERAGCALCEHMANALQRALKNSNISVKRVNVDADSALKAKYDWDVPLLFSGEHEICRHKLDIKALHSWLATVSSTSALPIRREIR